MTRIKVTLKMVKDDLKNDAIVSKAPPHMQRATVLFILNEVFLKSPAQYEVTDKTREAIEKYADSLVQ